MNIDKTNYNDIELIDAKINLLESILNNPFSIQENIEKEIKKLWQDRGKHLSK